MCKLFFAKLFRAKRISVNYRVIAFHLNVDSKIFLNVISSDFSKRSLGFMIKVLFET